MTTPNTLTACGLLALAGALITQEPEITRANIPQHPAVQPINAESRTPISRLPYRIDTCGSYYVTACLTGTTGSHGITIAANDVTLDLNGNTLHGVQGALNGIHVEGVRENVSVSNGSVRGWQNGVNLNNANGAQCESIRAFRNTVNGIHLGAFGLAQSCTAYANGASGIRATGASTEGGASIMDCVVAENTSAGISASDNASIQRTLAAANGATGISIGNYGIVAESTANKNADHGVDASESLIIGNSIQNNGTSNLAGSNNTTDQHNRY